MGDPLLAKRTLTDIFGFQSLPFLCQHFLESRGHLSLLCLY